MIFDWIAAVLELMGVWKIGNKDKSGFIIAGLCNITWMVVALTTTPKLYGLLSVVIILLFINIRNYIKWKKEEAKNVEPDK